MERYGVEYKNNPEKAKITSLEKYGAVFPIHSDTIQKRKNTQIERYGCLAFHKMSAREKTREAFKEKYGKSEGRELYVKEVMKYTNKQNLSLLENFDKRGRFSYHLDHKYSISEGWKNNILPYIIGSIYNLEMLEWNKNISKGAKCSTTLDEIINKFEKE